MDSCLILLASLGTTWSSIGVLDLTLQGLRGVFPFLPFLRPSIGAIKSAKLNVWGDILSFFLNCFEWLLLLGVSSIRRSEIDLLNFLTWCSIPFSGTEKREVDWDFLNSFLPVNLFLLGLTGSWPIPSMPLTPFVLSSSCSCKELSRIAFKQF